MKHFVSLLLSLSMIVGVSGCSSENSSSNIESEPIATQEEQDILIAYFSWSGNTERMARMIQEEVGGDLFKIEPAIPYAEDYDALIDQAQLELSENARPELAAEVENWDEYEVIFVGYPNWWNDAPMLVLNFLESYDFSQKTLIPFNTSGGSGFGNSLDSVENSASGTNILEGLSVYGDSVEDSQEEILSWLSNIGF